MKKITLVSCAMGLFLAGCCGGVKCPPSAAEPVTPVAVAAPPAPPAPPVNLPTVRDLEGRPVPLASLLQDRVTNKADGAVSVDHADFLLLVVTGTECGWSRKFAEELRPLVGELKDQKVRSAIVLTEDKKGGAGSWAKYGVAELDILVDEGRVCYDTYVKTKTPSVNVIDGAGVLLLSIDGYVDPRTVVDKISRRDFSTAPAAGG